jgi:sulfite exporter TauE/SafE
MEILTAFLIGLAGSFHCIGMCGPIALALPVPKSNTVSFFTGRILYNFGRIISYSFMGLFFGFLGEKLIISGYQGTLSITLGILILVYFLLPLDVKKQFTQLNFIQWMINLLKTKLGLLLKQKKEISFLALGFLNGFLPCGFVYIGLAGAISTGNPFDGMMFMFLFGLGTFPLMFIVSILGKIISVKVRQNLSRLTPIFVIIFAFLFIIRGMNLGIPYISPKIDSSSKVHKMMHH